MGLFSFFKDSGEKNTETKGMDNTAKAELMTNLINKYNLGIEGLKIEVDEAKASVWGITENQAVKEKVILAIGNVKGIAEVDDFIAVKEAEVKAPEAKFYTVQSGDSLSKISKAVYGDPMKYNDIFEANKPMLKDVNLIYPGQMLRIPELG